MIRSILLKGYYGFGNFGDDLLFVVSWRWLRKSFPQADIKVCTESLNPNYLGSLVSERVEVVRNGDNVRVDLIFHGGGGTYFDFRGGPAAFYLLNLIIRLLGRPVYDRVQQWRGRSRVKGRIRAGVGIGIGEYTASSRRLPFDFIELGEFDLLAVRDEQSLKQLDKLGIKSPSMLASDMAFLVSSWVPAVLPAFIPKRLGIVLRDWLYDDHAHLSGFDEAVDRLTALGYSLVFFSFDAADEVYRSRFSSRGEWIAWNPKHISIGEFVRSLSLCEGVVASRAHGVLTAVCLGIPVVCLEIEPKLTSVAGMVPHSVIRVSSPFLADSILRAVQNLPLRTPDHWEATRSEIEENARKLLAALDRVNELAQKP
jgi:polysaccharide pyruvyl transferase WcaK-like protein